MIPKQLRYRINQPGGDGLKRFAGKKRKKRKERKRERKTSLEEGRSSMRTLKSY